MRGRTMTPERLVSLTARIGEAQDELRAVHLKYHLTTAELLTATKDGGMRSCGGIADGLRTCVNRNYRKRVTELSR
jgi:hypothetical protein